MGLDIRIPLGLVFLLIGGIMGVFGLCTHGDAALYQKSLGININLVWGGLMFAFGKRKKATDAPVTPDSTD